MASNSDEDDVQEELLREDLTEIEKILKKQLVELDIAVPLEFQNEELPEGSSTSEVSPPLSKSSRILSIVKRHVRAEKALLKKITDLKKELNDQQLFLEEIEMERDVLLQQVHTYLETNSSLRVRLEEQRCQTGTLQGKLNADLESRIKSLESDKEKLSDLNLEKDHKLRKMNLLLEQTEECLRNKEAQVAIQKNEESNLISVLKSDLRKALEEKKRLEEKYTSLKSRIEDYFMNKNMEDLLEEKNSLKRSRSNTPKAERTPKSWIEEAFRSRPEDVFPLPRTPPVHAQLKALKGDLLNVTRKLESLKCQLVTSGIVEEEPKQAEIRRLKRKAKPIEDHGEGISEEQKAEFKNLKNILQDARNLNVKLQNLREEKQRIFDLNKKEAGVQATEKQETRHRSFQRAVTKLKKAVSECEEKLEGGVITGEEALAGLVSPLYACILSNSRCFHECRKRTGSEFNDETDTDSLMDDGSTEASSPGEDGGGDNLLKKRISNRGLDCRELKSQTAHLKCKIEHLQEI